MTSEVVVTSYGVVSPIGCDPSAFEANLFAGRSGVRSIRGTHVSADFPVPYAAWIPLEELPPSPLSSGGRRVPKSWLMTEIAVRQALSKIIADSSGLGPKNPLPKIDAIVYGTADGVSYELVESTLSNNSLDKFRPELTRSEGPLGIINETIQSFGGERVPELCSISLNAACASGNQTLGIALESLRAGRWERCLVGGVDARCEASNFLNFLMLGALTTADLPPEKASRPFASDRSGFVRGEGAAVLILETREAAKARGAEILGVVSGYGCTSDAFRLTDGRDDGECVIQAMRQAIETAGLEPRDIDSINSHGTSTPLNDRLETLAIKRLFGDHAYQMPITALKSQIGHSTIAASALEAISCLLMLKHQRVSPTLNLESPDPECDLDYVPLVSRPARLKHILSNSFGFGGQNTCIVFSHPQDAR